MAEQSFLSSFLSIGLKSQCKSQASVDFLHLKWELLSAVLHLTLEQY